MEDMAKQRMLVGYGNSAVKLQLAHNGTAVTDKEDCVFVNVGQNDLSILIPPQIPIELKDEVVFTVPGGSTVNQLFIIDIDTDLPSWKPMLSQSYEYTYDGLFTAKNVTVSVDEED